MIGFALPYGTDPASLNTIAASGGSTTAYNASDSASLDAAFKSIFDDIFRRTERALAQQLGSIAADASPFLEVPAEESRAEWVEPTIVVDVEFLDRTPDGRLRHPVYVSQRMDLDAADLR